MQVIHVRTDASSSECDSAFITMVVSMIDGVRDVAAVPSIGLTSVLYDERRIDPSGVVEAVRSAGFGAHEWGAEERLVALPATAA